MFAILTLVAFMMTLVPALAFAGNTAGNALTVKINATGQLVLTASDSTIYKTTADGTVADVTAKITEPVAPTENDVYGAITTAGADLANNEKITSNLYTVNEDVVTLAGYADSLSTSIAALNDGAEKTAATAALKAITDIENVNGATLTSNLTAAKTASETAEKAVETQKEEAKKAGSVAKGTSGVYSKTTSADASAVTANSDSLEFEVDLKTASGAVPAEISAGNDKLFVWVERTSKALSDVDYISWAEKSVGSIGYLEIKKDDLTSVFDSGYASVFVKSAQSGKVTVKAGFGSDIYDAVDKAQLLAANETVTGEFSAVSSNADDFIFNVTGANDKQHDGSTSDEAITGADANSNSKYTVAVTVLNKEDQPVKDQKVTISANKSGIDLEKEEVKTDNRGRIEFDVTATKSGKFVVTVAAGSKSKDLHLSFAATTAINAEITKAPATTVAVDSEVTFKVAAKDVYGNKVSRDDVFNIKNGSAIAKLGDKEYKLQYNPTETSNEGNGDIVYNFTPSKVGTYTVTFKLDNGKKATTTLEVAEQGKITEMQINYDADTVRLGAKTNAPEIVQVDAAGVTKTATSANITFAVTGKGVNDFKSKTGVLTVSAEDKYIGEVLTVTAVDKTNNISATTTLTIADAAQALKFNGTAGVTGQDANIPFNVIDANGNKIALGDNVTGVTATAVVTSKPDGANATAVVNKENDLKDKGVAILQVNSNKDGEVKVQVMVEVGYPKVGTVDVHTEYYTGVATVTFGEQAVEGANSTATMIMGSTTFVANGKVVTSDVAPFVKDGRTFLPIRALGEALGAEVSFDEATNVVTIKLDGKTVTMTLGSAVMTVGDKVVTMDTAAYATAEGRTVVPVRFAAEALGFNVEAVYATDGTTSAVNFSK